MTDDLTPNTPTPDEPVPDSEPVSSPPPPDQAAPGAEPPKVTAETPTGTAQDDLVSRLERLGGEPAPDITPEEFARLQQAGQIHIDPRGRVRTTQRDETDAGISLRKRRAWYRA